MKSNFPKDFLIGSASAAYHFEGGFNRDGKLPSVADVIPHAPHEGRTEKPEPGNLKHRAIEFYDRYKSDIELFGELGLKAFRTSIAWSRIYPTGIEDTPNEEGLKFYDKMFDELLSKGIQPCITMTHTGEMPLYLADNYNGFANKEVVHHYLKFVRTIVDRYKDKVKIWFTFNEVNIAGFQLFFQAGVSQDPETIDDSVRHQVYHNMFVANAGAIKIVKELSPDAKVGCTTVMGPIYPLTSKPEDNLQAFFDGRDRLFHTDVHVFGKYPDWKLKQIKDKNIKIDITEEELALLEENTVDFVAYSYYMSGVSEYKNEEKLDGDVNVLSRLKKS